MIKDFSYPCDGDGESAEVYHRAHDIKIIRVPGYNLNNGKGDQPLSRSTLRAYVTDQRQLSETIDYTFYYLDTPSERSYLKVPEPSAFGI